MGFKELFRAEGLPAFQNRRFASAAAARACPRGDMVLGQDSGTGLIRNRAFDPALPRYDAAYRNEQAHSPAFREQLAGALAVFDRQFSGRSVLEIGCGKGYFLERLLAAGFSVRGADPAYEGANPAVIKSEYSPALGLRAEVLALRHVLEHVADPYGFLRGLAEANGGGGLVYIEVPCFDRICRARAWYDVYYEHANYFRLSDLRAFFGEVREAGSLFGGQFIYVAADLASLRLPAARPGDEAELPPDFLGGVRACAAAGPGAAVWGAAGRGSTLAHYLERAGAPAALAVDIDPAKQGTFLAGTGLPVVSPEAARARLPRGAAVFITNSLYAGEIAGLFGDGYRYIGVDHD